MSQTKVQLPVLAPHEFATLMGALEFYYDNEKAVALDKDADYRLKNEARANATKAQDLLTKLR